MAKSNTKKSNEFVKIKKKTSIGHSHLSRPKNKHKRRMTKPYNGQG